MARLKRLFYIILLNVLISGITTLVLLYAWEQRRSLPANPTDPVVLVVTAPSEPVAEASPTIPNDAQIPLEGQGSSSSPTPENLDIPVEMYRVQVGDSLSSISVKFDVSLVDLLAVNNLPDPNTLTIGQIIYIPTGPAPTSTAAPPPSATPRPTATPMPEATQRRITPSPTPEDWEPLVVIETILGVGDPGTERAQIHYTGGGELALTGWTLEDQDGNRFTFPQLILYSGGAVYVYTQAGTDTVIELHWGLSQSIWQRGELAILCDDQGKERATYQIP